METLGGPFQDPPQTSGSTYVAFSGWHRGKPADAMVFDCSNHQNSYQHGFDWHRSDGQYSGRAKLLWHQLVLCFKHSYSFSSHSGRSAAVFCWVLPWKACHTNYRGLPASTGVHSDQVVSPTESRKADANQSGDCVGKDPKLLLGAKTCHLGRSILLVTPC